MHRYFVLEAPEQGIARTSIFCTLNSHSIPHYSKPRFDWISVMDPVTNVRIVCQLCGLWELRRRRTVCTSTKSVLYYSCIPTVPVSMGRVSNRVEAFKKLRYDLYGKRKDLKIITDKMDTLLSPEAVFPVTLNERDYTLTSKAQQESCSFYHVSFHFLFKEGWDVGSVNLYATLEDTINCSPSAKQFISSTREERTEMHKALIRNIESNEFVEDETPDAAIIQGALLQTR